MLGLEALIRRKQDEADSINPSPDEWQTWFSHPITRKFFTQLQIDLYNAKMNQSTPASQEAVRVFEQILSFGAKGMAND